MCKSIRESCPFIASSLSGGNSSERAVPDVRCEPSVGGASDGEDLRGDPRPARVIYDYVSLIKLWGSFVDSEYKHLNSPSPLSPNKHPHSFIEGGYGLPFSPLLLPAPKPSHRCPPRSRSIMTHSLHHSILRASATFCARLSSPLLGYDLRCVLRGGDEHFTA